MGEPPAGDSFPLETLGYVVEGPTARGQLSTVNRRKEAPQCENPGFL